jgi:hypothetical protein
MTKCQAYQASDQMRCPCGLGWDVNDIDPPVCPNRQQSEDRRRATPVPGPIIERRRAPRTSSMSPDEAHRSLMHLSAVLRASPVASAHGNKIGTGAATLIEYEELLIGHEVLRVLKADVRKALSAPGRVVVCAAVKLRTTRGMFIAAGPRHFDAVMREQIDIAMDRRNFSLADDQGFIDQWGVFMSREEALIVAYYAKQLGRRPKGYPLHELFSEDLY